MRLSDCTHDDDPPIADELPSLRDESPSRLWFGVERTTLVDGHLPDRKRIK
jgi:hypothetical protein